MQYCTKDGERVGRSRIKSKTPPRGGRGVLCSWFLLSQTCPMLAGSARSSTKHPSIPGGPFGVIPAAYKTQDSSDAGQAFMWGACAGRCCSATVSAEALP